MFLNSKINLLSGLATVLVLGFSSCTEVPVDTEQILHRKVVDEYKSNFIARYGQPAADQSWDFSGRNKDNEIELLQNENTTRVISSVASIINEYDLPPEINVDVLAPILTENELSYIRANLGDTEAKAWAPNIYEKCDLWPYYFKGNGIAYSYFLGVHSSVPGTGSYGSGTEYFTDLPVQGYPSGTIWRGYNGYSSYGFRIDASALETGAEEVYWYASTDYLGNPLTNASLDDAEFRERCELTTYKEIVTPLGALFWCFDCDHNGDYSDLVCLVEPVNTKRFLIEDLGALDDFDFNDIVVDVLTSNYTGKQTAIVRAMGGTLDFDLTIGNTTWSKSGNNFDAATPYNADAGVNNNNNSAKLCEFEVTGWEPDQNNISVTVKKEDSNDTSNGVFTITFPKTGEVPMIIAVDRTFYFTDPDDTSTKYYWMPERVSIPSSYFTTE